MSESQRPPETVEPLSELLELTAALGAHLEMVKSSGAAGLPPASAETWQALERVYQASPPPRRNDARAVPGKPDAALDRARPAREAPERRAPGVEAAVHGAASRPERGAVASVQTRGPDAPDLLVPVLPVQPPKPLPEALSVLASRVRDCQKCGLARTRTQTVFARGTGASGLCFVGEGPGADEDAQGFPFVGKAGQLLDRMIEAMGFSRDEVYVCNIVKCRPPDNRKPEPEEMSQCMPYLNEQLALVEPQVIVALGATAVLGLLGTSGGITRLRGRWRLYQGKIPVMPTFHPAYLLRTPSAKREVWEDLQAVLRQMGRPVPGRS
ncbi:MAG TPA: uracil-DNA glycosylase family protein [Polyangiaceae bacterium]|nr:uracil-DNA glycosylase family protein [Polyangiaceae bacterium]